MTRFQLILCEIEGWVIPDAPIPSLSVPSHKHEWYLSPVMVGYECDICKAFVSNKDIQMHYGQSMMEMSGSTKIADLLNTIVDTRVIA